MIKIGAKLPKLSHK